MDPQRPKTLKEIALEAARQQKLPQNRDADKRQAIQSVMRLIGEMSGQDMANAPMATDAEHDDLLDDGSLGLPEVLGGPEQPDDGGTSAIEPEPFERLDTDALVTGTWSETSREQPEKDTQSWGVIEERDSAMPLIGSQGFLDDGLEFESIGETRDDSDDPLPNALKVNPQTEPLFDSLSAIVRKINVLLGQSQAEGSIGVPSANTNSRRPTEPQHPVFNDLLHRRGDSGGIMQLPHLPGELTESQIQLLSDEPSKSDATTDTAPNSDPASRTNPMTLPTDDGGPPLARPLVMLSLAEDQKRQIIDETVSSAAKRDAQTLDESKVNDAFWHYNCQMRALH